MIITVSHFNENEKKVATDLVQYAKRISLNSSYEYTLGEYVYKYKDQEIYFMAKETKLNGFELIFEPYAFDVFLQLVKEESE